MSEFTRRTFLAGVATLFIPVKADEFAPLQQKLKAPNGVTLAPGRWYGVDVFNSHPAANARLTVTSSDGQVRVIDDVPPGHSYRRHFFTAQGTLVVHVEGGDATLVVHVEGKLYFAAGDVRYEL